MKVHVHLVRFNFNEGRTLISTIHKPSWFEWLFLFRRKKQVQYLGRGKTWYFYPTMTAITSQSLLDSLQKKERQYKILKGNKSYVKLRNP